MLSPAHIDAHPPATLMPRPHPYANVEAPPTLTLITATTPMPRPHPYAHAEAPPTPAYSPAHTERPTAAAKPVGHPTRTRSARLKDVGDAHAWSSTVFGPQGTPCIELAGNFL